MPTRLLRLLALLMAALAGARAVAEPTRWSGVVELPGRPLKFSVALEADSGTISIKSQGIADKKLDEVSVKDGRIAFTLTNPGGGANNALFEFKIADDGKSAEGTLKQAGLALKARLGPYVPEESPRRPQDPRPPLPYAASDVEVEIKPEGRAAFKLAGTLTIPEGKGPFPAVVLITGSGQQNRDEELVNHRPFLVIADHLTRAGIAVLRCDDRGAGRSGGDFKASTTDDFVDDALAQVAFLRMRPEIDPARIGLVGHSEGGLIAPMAAAKSDQVAYIVLLAGPGMPSVELLALQGRLINEAGGAPKEFAARNADASAEVLAMVRDGKPMDQIRERLTALLREIMRQAPAEPGQEAGKVDEEELKKTVEQQMAGMDSPWLKRFLRIDPATALRQVKVPILALNGAKDLQVPSKENTEGIRKATEGNKDVTIRELDGLNHLFQKCDTGSPAEYEKIEQTFSPDALDAMTAWLREHAGLGGAKPK